MVKPINRRSFGSFFGTVMAGAFGGFLVAIPATLIGAQVLAGNSLGGFEDLVGAIMGMLLGYPLGVVLGILVYSRVFHYPGSVWLAVPGVLTGMVLILGLAEPLNLNSNTDVMLGSYFILTALLATAGFHLKKIAKP